MATVGDLIINLRTNTASFERDMRRANSRVTEFGQKTSESGAKVIRFGADTASTSGKVLRSTDALVDMGRAAGIGGEGMSAMGRTISLTATLLMSMSGLLNKVTKSLGDIKVGATGAATSLAKVSKATDLATSGTIAASTAMTTTTTTMTAMGASAAGAAASVSVLKATLVALASMAATIAIVALPIIALLYVFMKVQEQARQVKAAYEDMNKSLKSFVETLKIYREAVTFDISTDPTAGLAKTKRAIDALNKEIEESQKEMEFPWMTDQGDIDRYRAAQNLITSALYRRRDVMEELAAVQEKQIANELRLAKVGEMMLDWETTRADVAKQAAEWISQAADFGLDKYAKQIAELQRTAIARGAPLETTEVKALEARAEALRGLEANASALAANLANSVESASRLAEIWSKSAQQDRDILRGMYQEAERLKDTLKTDADRFKEFAASLEDLTGFLTPAEMNALFESRYSELVGEPGAERQGMAQVLDRANVDIRGLAAVTDMDPAQRKRQGIIDAINKFREAVIAKGGLN